MQSICPTMIVIRDTKIVHHVVLGVFLGLTIVEQDGLHLGLSVAQDQELHDRPWNKRNRSSNLQSHILLN